MGCFLPEAARLAFQSVWDDELAEAILVYVWLVFMPNVKPMLFIFCIHNDKYTDIYIYNIYIHIYTYIYIYIDRHIPCSHMTPWSKHGWTILRLGNCHQSMDMVLYLFIVFIYLYIHIQYIPNITMVWCYVDMVFYNVLYIPSFF